MAFGKEFTVDGAIRMRITLIDADGTDEQGVGPTSEYARDPDWSPDGTMLVWSYRDAGESSIWRMNADGQGAAKISTILDAYVPRR